ncbi:hypothetical protein Ade02nite_36200 [Paractinoplanes deccanensis]|uniref:STAS domain-containing protein n=2 Tax=Paractinoplanes deccanensis TaxID=113561 RepID=A0ABQ3Y4P8_9ACTN|nr:hypothetical protein Ade02nite_36200 [Actinoplanes deccanensis]
MLVTSVRKGDATVRITVMGELDAATAPRLRAEAAKAITGGVRTAELDLAGVTFLGVPGVREIMSLRESTQVVLVHKSNVVDWVIRCVCPELVVTL